MADKFEIMKVYIPLKLGVQTDKVPGMVTITNTPTSDDGTEEEWEKASQLAKEGWELVGSIPVTGSSIVGMLDSSIPKTVSHSFTTGYELFFKRRIE